MYAAMLLLTVVGACHCGAEMYCVESGGCCGYEDAVACEQESCCPSGSKCTSDGLLCERNAVLTKSLPIIRNSEGNCVNADRVLRAAIQRAIAAPSYTTFLAAIDLYMQGKEICHQGSKLALTPGSCMLDFLLLETDARVSYWNLAKGDIKSAFNSLLSVLVWIPYLNADCLA